MYIPRHFAETRVDVLHDLIRRHPLGTLVVAAADGPEASHVPFEISPEPAPFGTLRCHVARANPIWQQISAERPVLVVFQGEEGYVSPSWYVGKQEHGKSCRPGTTPPFTPMASPRLSTMPPGCGAWSRI